MKGLDSDAGACFPQANGRMSPEKSDGPPLPREGERPGMGKTRKGKFKMSAEFSAKSLIKALTTYKLEAIAEMKKVRAAVEAEK